MPRRSYRIPFAASGEKTSIPEATQPDGAVSMSQGFGPDYERPTDGSDPLAKVFPRLPYNGMINEITASIGEIQQYGFAIWQSDMTPYPINACVRHNDQNWQSTIANNSATPGAANSNWSNIGATEPVGVRRARFTTSGTLVVPAGVTVIYVSGCAGGGGGGGGAGRSNTDAWNSSGGGGGGAGRSAIRQAYSVNGPVNIPVTIGLGGTGGNGGASNTFGSNGADGGVTSLGTLLSLAGGGGGQGGQSGNLGVPGVGGSPGGQAGEVGSRSDNQGGGGGQGGSGPFGTAGGGSAGVRNFTAPAPTVGFGFGTGGGGGGGVGIGSAGVKGGNGMPGYLEIEW